MSLRSLLLAAFLLAALAAAQSDLDWRSDMLTSVWLNMSATRICVADAPSTCYYIPRVDLPLDPRRTLVVAVWRSGANIYSDVNPIGNYYLLRYVMDRSWYSWYVVNIPRPGLLYSGSPFSIGPAGSRSQVPATSYTACGRTYLYAYYVNAPGAYNITPFYPSFYLVDLATCIEYRIVAHKSNIINATRGWFSLYLAELMPHTWRIMCDTTGSAASYSDSCTLNGTLHAYLTYFHWFLHPRGSGFYIMGPRASMTLVMPQFTYHAFRSIRGPVAFDALSGGYFRITGGTPGDVLIAYNIGLPPGDGFMMAVLFGAVAQGAARLAYVAENTTGYFVIQHPAQRRGAGYVTYHRRYAVVDVALADDVYLYHTRGFACPLAYYNAGWGLNRLDRIYEVEICNNRTDTLYVALYTASFPSYLVESIYIPGFHAYLYGDVVPPRRCARLRWDPTIVTKPELRVYAAPGGVCAAANNFTLSTMSYNPGWRYFLFPNNTLKPVGPISPDYDYASLLRQLLDLLGRRYRNLLGNFSRWLSQQSNATNATSRVNITDFFASQPRFLGNIRMESATSTWLRTVLNELQRWQAVGAPPTFGAVSLPPAPAAVAPAAAVAVAVAWAASRRDDDVATTAAVAGIALALFGILMTLIYGTSSLTLVALGVIVAAAAAAWRRIT